ncbi:hypothetical protein D3C71_524420 [compost metagenome]
MCLLVFSGATPARAVSIVPVEVAAQGLMRCGARSRLGARALAASAAGGGSLPVIAGDSRFA